MSYQTSKRRLLKELLTNIKHTSGASLQEMSAFLGQSRNYLSNTVSMNHYETKGDVSEETFDKIITSLNKKYVRKTLPKNRQAVKDIVVELRDDFEITVVDMCKHLDKCNSYLNTITSLSLNNLKHDISDELCESIKASLDKLYKLKFEPVKKPTYDELMKKGEIEEKESLRKYSINEQLILEAARIILSKQ